ncbi:uncharacterized protein RHO25_012264 [Cercospora beticola]|nr:hypothetical protein RHO25_012264 [Cercospora beticola]
MVSTFPLIHVGGTMTALFWPLYLGSVATLLETGVPSSPDDVFRMLQLSRATLLAAQPSLLTSIASSVDMVSRINGLSRILTGSAPLSTAVIDRLQEGNGPTILNLYGSTETLPLCQRFDDQDDWPYISFKEDSGVSFRRETDDLYELILKKTASEQVLSVFCSLPELDTFESKDLFSPHPQKSGLWRFVCRKDDLVSLAGGQGINVGDMEMRIQESPLVDTAIIGMDGRPATMLLVVPEQQPVNDQERASVQDAIWPFVERANEHAHPYAAVQKNMVLVLQTREKLSATTDKGSLKRQSVIEQYKADIDRVYSAARSSS